MSKCCTVVVKEELNVNNTTFKIDLESAVTSQLKENSILRVGILYDESTLKDSEQTFMDLYDDMIYMGHTLEKSASFLFSNFIHHKSMRTSIIEWGRKNKTSQEDFVLIRVIRERSYFLIALITSFEKIKFDNSITYKLSTIHPEIEELMGNASVKKIKL